MKRYLTLDWFEQRDIYNEGYKEGFKEGFKKGINLSVSCFKFVRAGLSDEKIAEQLGYDLPEIQEIIDNVRARLPSYPR